MRIYNAKPIFKTIPPFVLSYLLGNVFKLFRIGIVDELSGKVSNIKKKYNPRIALEEAVNSKFPYIDWLEEFSLSLPVKSQEHFTKTWKKYIKNTSQYTYYKHLLCSISSQISNEVYAQEALTRYLSMMFYSLSISSITIIVSILTKIYFYENITILCLLLIVYVFIIITILFRLRYVLLLSLRGIFF